MPRATHQPTNAEILKHFDEHTKDDQRFQVEARGFNGEMSQFKAETEGALADMLRQLQEMDKKLTDHMTKMEPYLQGAAGLGLLWKFFIAIGSVAAAWLTIRSLLTPWKG